VEAQRHDRRTTQHKEAMNTPCILFDGCLTPKGYGRRSVKGKMKLAHRVVYCEHNGIALESIKGRVVRHRCDNPSCINPLHLEIGTQAQNVADAVERDRHAKGDRHPNAKISWLVATQIRSEYAPRSKDCSMSALSRRYGLSKTQIYRILHDEKWKDAA